MCGKINASSSKKKSIDVKRIIALFLLTLVLLTLCANKDASNTSTTTQVNSNQTVDTIIEVSTTVYTSSGGYYGKLIGPFRINLTLTGEPRLGNIVDLKTVMWSPAKMDFPNASVNVTLSEGFELVSGNLSWNGLLEAEKVVELNSKIKAIRIGNEGVGAIAWHSWRGSGDFNINGLNILVGVDNATVVTWPVPDYTMC